MIDVVKQTRTLIICLALALGMVPAPAMAQILIDNSGLGLGWSTYLNQYSGFCADYDLAVDTEGNIYAIGRSGYFLGMYLIKLTSTGEHLWTTILGEPNTDYDGLNITLDQMGSIYLSGMAAFGDHIRKSFVMKTTSEGIPLWTTILGEAGLNSWGGDITLDETTGSIYVTGGIGSETEETWISGGYDTTQGILGGDGFVAKLSNDGVILWSTYIGGDTSEDCFGIATDQEGAVYVVGDTTSNDWILSGYDTTLNGIRDGFIVKLSPDGDHLWSTYLGGDQFDSAIDININPSDEIYVRGKTYSADWVTGGFNTTFSGYGCDFIMKIDTNGTPLWSTYVGSYRNNPDTGMDEYASAVDDQGFVYIAGLTYVTDWMPDTMPSNYQGNGDTYVARISPDGQRLLWATCIGGRNYESVCDMTQDNRGNLYVIGATDSDAWTTGGYLTTMQGSHDCYIAKIVDKVGELRVTIGSAEAGADGGRWRRVGTDAWFASGKTEEFVPVGEWEIEFEDVTDWITPANVSAVVAKDERTDASGLYGATGGLRVTLWPAAAAADGARWRRAGTEVWLKSGVSESGIPVGEYRIEFLPLAKWAEPLNILVTINMKTTTASDALYTRKMGALTVRIYPPAAVAAGAMWRRVGTTDWLPSGHMLTAMPTDEYTIEFTNLSGWDRPVDRGAIVRWNKTTRLSAWYAESDLNAADPALWNLYE